MTTFGRRAREPLGSVHAAPLVRFLAPSAPSNGSSPLPRACLARYVPSPGFPTLLAACSSPVSRALFHARALLEFHPFRALPTLPEPRGLSASPLPSCPWSSFLRRPLHPCSLCRSFMSVVVHRRRHRPGFKALLPGSCSDRRPREVNPAVRPLLSWVSAPLQGSPSTARAAGASTTAPSSSLLPAGSASSAAKAAVSPSGVAGSSKSSRSRDRSRHRET